MSMLLRLTRAVARGRAKPPRLANREELLVSLLNKRAVARNAGAESLEAMLRAQILWSLPTIEPDQDIVEPSRLSV